MSTIHIHEDQLERYSKDLLSEPEQRRCEEHLLICEACRNALEETEGYVSAMQAAARHFLKDPECPPVAAVVATTRRTGLDSGGCDGVSPCGPSQRNEAETVTVSTDRRPCSTGVDSALIVE